MALVREGAGLEKLKLDGDEAIGLAIVRKSIEAPLRTIAENAGVEGSVIVEKVRESKKATEGFNAANLQYEDLMKSGVVDPTKVVRTCLENAASISALLLTTEAAVAEVPKEEDEGHHH